MNQPILTSRQSKDARDQLGMSQRKAAADSGLPRFTLNQFETRKVVPADNFLQLLREFYENQGAVIEDAEPVEPDQKVLNAEALQDRYYLDGYVVTGAMSQDEAEQILEELALVEERVGTIMDEPIEKDWLFDSLTNACQERQKELQVLMARAYILTRKLQGRSTVEPCTKDDFDNGEPEDQAGLLGGLFTDALGFLEDDEADAA